MSREQAAMWERPGKEDADIKDGRTCIMESFAVIDRQAIKMLP